MGIPWWLSRWRICLQCRRPGFNRWVGKIPWRREWLPIMVFLLGGSPEQRILVGYNGVAKSWTWLSNQLSLLQVNVKNVMPVLPTWLQVNSPNHLNAGCLIPCVFLKIYHPSVILAQISSKDIQVLGFFGFHKDVFKNFLFSLFLRNKDHEWRLQQENNNNNKSFSVSESIPNQLHFR